MGRWWETKDLGLATTQIRLSDRLIFALQKQYNMKISGIHSCLLLLLFELCPQIYLLYKLHFVHMVWLLSYVPHTSIARYLILEYLLSHSIEQNIYYSIWIAVMFLKQVLVDYYSSIKNKTELPREPFWHSKQSCFKYCHFYQSVSVGSGEMTGWVMLFCKHRKASSES